MKKVIRPILGSFVLGLTLFLCGCNSATDNIPADYIGTYANSIIGGKVYIQTTGAKVHEIVVTSCTINGEIVCDNVILSSAMDILHLIMMQMVHLVQHPQWIIIQWVEKQEQIIFI